MARPHKQTVDYFPHDTDTSDGKTVTIIQAKYGNDGYAFWFKMLELLGKSNGLYYDFNNPADLEFLSAKTHQKDTETTKDVLETLTILGAIDSELYKYGFIWCQNFTDRVADAFNRTERGVPQRPGYLVNVVDNKDSVAKEGISANTNSKNTTEIQQKKLKETRVYNNIYSLFEVWNSEKIVVHKKLTDRMKTVIIRTLKDYTSDEIKQAIKNYAEILHGVEYYFNYTWGLDTFLQRGMRSFNLDPNVVRNNFRKEDAVNGKNRNRNERVPDHYETPEELAKILE